MRQQAKSSLPVTGSFVLAFLLLILGLVIWRQQTDLQTQRLVVSIFATLLTEVLGPDLELHAFQDLLPRHEFALGIAVAGELPRKRRVGLTLQVEAMKFLRQREQGPETDSLKFNRLFAREKVPRKVKAWRYVNAQS